MVSLKPGDRVIIRLKEAKVVDPYSTDFDDTKILEIVATSNNGYYLFVPQYIFIHGTVVADRFYCKDYKISPKYLGDDILHVSEGKVYKVFSILNGMTCSTCGEYYDYAAPNQLDGSLICWACRNRDKSS